MSTYAIVESGGKQYRVAKGDSLLVDRLPEDEGAKVSLRPVFFRGDGTKIVLDGGDLEKVKVDAVVAEHLRGEKIRVFKYKPKKGYRRRAGHRSELTRLEVTEVKMLARKPAATAAAKPEDSAAKPGAAPPKPRAAAKKPATTKKAPARKAPARRTTKKAS